jgi:NAD(P)-dependent dehydrogenase (short-subunit alcohol dehydrogenase family)
MANDKINVQSPRMNPGALVITGGGRGIGAQIALGAAGAGTPVALVYRSRSDAASRVVAEIEAAGGRAIAIASDVGSETDVLRAFDIVDHAFGNLSGLVNNAVTAGEPTRLAELRMEQLELLFRTNVFGSFLCAREAAKRLSIRNGGSGGAIVTMSSSVAIKTGGPGAYVSFSACKGALETMSQGLAKELAEEGVRVNVVRCGVIDTETRRTQGEDRIQRLLAQVPMARMGTPTEVAAAVLWLLSAEASYVTGATLDVTGGF